MVWYVWVLRILISRLLDCIGCKSLDLSMKKLKNVNRYSPIKVAVTGHHTCHQGKSMLAEYIYRTIS